MMKKLTYRKQFLAYSLSYILILLFVYIIAFKPTLNLKKDCKKKEATVAALVSAPQRIKLTTSRLNQINNQFSNVSTQGSITRDLILDEISEYCDKNKLTITDYPESHFSKSNMFEIETNRMVVTGNFKGLVKLINHLETRASFGRIVAVNLFSEENRKTKRTSLFLELFIQNIRNDETED